MQEEESQGAAEALRRVLGFAEYVVDTFERSSVFYWKMWGPLGEPMIRVAEGWASAQRFCLGSLREASAGRTPQGRSWRNQAGGVQRQGRSEGSAGADEGSARGAEEDPREEIRSTIRESVRRSAEGSGRQEPQAGTTPAPEEGRADAEGPPVEDHDSLSLGQVNQRLLELSVEEVERLRDHEAENRNRPSVMNRYERRLGAARENREGEGSAGAGESGAGEEG